MQDFARVILFTNNVIIYKTLLICLCISKFIKTMTITEIKQAVEKLSINEQQELFEWLDELREKRLDQEIEQDFQEGKLDHLIASARKEFAQGKCQQI